MDFAFTPEQEKIRAEARQFLKANRPEQFDLEAEDCGSGLGGWSRAFVRRMAAEGWITRFWPKEYGGQGGSVMERLAFIEEISYAHAPFKSLSITEPMAHNLFEFGSEFLKKEFLPRMATADVVFWMGFSEPYAGSDLLAAQTKAVEDGDHYVLSGQKIWSSQAHLSDYAYLLTRTDPDVPRHKGLTMFIVDKNTPGLTVRPMRNLLGVDYHAEVFFDDVRVEKKYLLGEKNKGFQLMMRSLASGDRFWAKAGKAAWCRRILDDLIEYANETFQGGQPISKNPVARRRLAELAVDIEACRLYFYQMAWMLDQGQSINADVSGAAVYINETGRRLFDTGIQMLGKYANLDAGSKWSRLGGKFARWHLLSVGHMIAGGTSEIQRNTVAVQGLKLPQQ